MNEPLRLVPSEKEKIVTLTAQAERVDKLVDELIAYNESLKEQMEQVRLALGIDHYDFDRLKSGDYVFSKSTEVGKVLRTLADKLEAALGH
jgi:hypothetical protein